MLLSFDADGNFAIATMAMLISVLIMKDTRNPENESIYNITRAGTISVIRISYYQGQSKNDNSFTIIL